MRKYGSALSHLTSTEVKSAIMEEVHELEKLKPLCFSESSCALHTSKKTIAQ
jgi:hypothetical protein